jgi:carboxyl-terminal processing protease
VHEQTPLNDGSAIRLTIARSYTPAGRCIQKPYQLGNNDDYNEEEWNRYLNGELFSSDSIKLNRKETFKTASGKVVYGGGGIIPDYFIPLDTSLNSSYHSEIILNGIVNDFCLIFHEKNPLLFSKYKNEDDYFDNFFPPSNIIKQLLAYSKSRTKHDYFQYSQNNVNELSKEIKLQFARLHFGKTAYFKGLTIDDRAYQKAAKILTSPKE